MLPPSHLRGVLVFQIHLFLECGFWAGARISSGLRPAPAEGFWNTWRISNSEDGFGTVIDSTGIERLGTVTSQKRTSGATQLSLSHIRFFRRRRMAQASETSGMS